MYEELQEPRRSEAAALMNELVKGKELLKNKSHGSKEAPFTTKAGRFLSSRSAWGEVSLGLGVVEVVISGWNPT